MKTIFIQLAKLKAMTETSQLNKIREEYLEFESGIDTQDKLEEAFDILQSVVTYINFTVGKDIKKYNKKHLDKMKRYAAANRVALD
ncbi:MAG: hypothetical protein J1G30_01250 [Spirochaetales bacterium]|nr:hypothetical protein [Spirochaetales bacterium]